MVKRSSRSIEEEDQEEIKLSGDMWIFIEARNLSNFKEILQGTLLVLILITIGL